MAQPTTLVPDAPAAPARRAHLNPRAAFVLLASIAVSFLAGSAAPTPLYASYQAQWGFSPITITVVFGVYAVAVLVALLVVGGLSDHVGRRPVLLTATLAQAVTMLLFATADGVPPLLGARVLQGLATGLALGAVGAGLLDLDRARGTVANAVAPLTGAAAGSAVGGLFVQFLPAPEQLVYLVLLAVFVAQAVGVALMAETSSRRPGVLASLRPTFALPAAVRRPMLTAVPALVSAWALAGLYGSLGPSLTRALLGSPEPALGGLSLSALATSAALSTFALRGVPARRTMAVGTGLLATGVAVTLVGVTAGSVQLFFAGTVVAGVGFGGAFQGAIRRVVPLAAEHERAGVLSVVYVVSYLAMGLPAVIAGYLVVNDGGLLAAAREYGAVAIGLALLALAGLSMPARRRATPCPAAPC